MEIRPSQGGSGNDRPPEEPRVEEPSSENLPMDPAPHTVTQRPPLGIVLPPGNLPAIVEEQGDPGPATRAKPRPRSAKLDFERAGPDACAFCGKLYISAPESGMREDKRVEVEAYLPCGHAFGHRCLNRYMQALKHDEKQPRSCPWGDCISLQHSCGHLCIPERTVVRHIIADKYSPVLEAVCEFCATDEGRNLREIIERHEQRRLHHLESSVSSSPLTRFIHKSHTRFFESLRQAQEEILEKGLLAYEQNRGKVFYNQWFEESRRRSQDESQNPPRNSRTQGSGSQQRDNQPSDSQPGNSQAGSSSSAQQSAPRRPSVALPDQEALRRRAEKRAVKATTKARRESKHVDELDQVDEVHESEEADQVEKGDKGKGKEKAIEETSGVEKREEDQETKGQETKGQETEQVQKEDKGKREMKPVELFDKPMPEGF